MTKLLLSTLCYGPEYAGLFVGPYCTALLHPSNLPAVKDRVAFELYTDQQTLDDLRQSMQFRKIQQLVETTVYVIQPSQYEERYQRQAETLLPALKHAAAMDAALMSFNADQCMSIGLLPKILKALDDGHGAIAAMPFRTTAEQIHRQLAEAAKTPDELFELAFPAMHPILIANHWESATFSNVPYQLVWSDAEQFVLRMTSVNLLAVKPTPAMLTATGCPDMVLWQHAENVLFATDWADFPVVAVEPLHCFWPAWTIGKRASPHNWLDFARTAGLTDALANLNTAWVFRHPTKRTDPAALIDQSQTVVDAITRVSVGATIALTA
ncbi:MAG: hypothetical protein ACR652_24400 [Methylocystis sp.]|uniref:hypothetical protein n=1 Tax=Methylocystis sp. TaxID=1911079 RepID=UPI003DA6C21C